MNYSMCIIMERLPVQSSNLRSIGYDQGDKILEVEFHGGRLYQYFDVPPEIYINLMASPSKGKYHAYFVKNRFYYKQIPYG